MHFKEISIKSTVCNYYSNNLVKANILETKNISIDQKNYSDLVIYSTWYHHRKSTKLLSLYYHELMRQVKEHEGKNYLMTDGYMLYKILSKIKDIGIGKFHDPEDVNMDDKLPVDIALKNFLLDATWY